MSIVLISSDGNRVRGNILEIQGLSTDEKPNLEVGDGSSFLEVDTGKIFIYNNKIWYEL